MIATHDLGLTSRCQRSIHLTDGHLVTGGQLINGLVAVHRRRRERKGARPWRVDGSLK